MKVAVIGFGSIGCRHAQSLCDRHPTVEVYVLERCNEIFKSNLKKIGSPNNCCRIQTVSDIDGSYDFVVVATPSPRRLDLIQALVRVGIPHILVEKVVFQTTNEFESFTEMELGIKSDVRVNMVSRYYSCYKEIKDRKSPRVNMIVSGGEYGLACNALHYVDVFQYITGAQPELQYWSLTKDEAVHKRGIDFIEVFGSMAWKTKRGDKLLLISGKEREGSVFVNIFTENCIDEICEGTATITSYQDGHLSFGQPSGLMPTSLLTSTLYDDMLDGSSLLPTVTDMQQIHKDLFRCINQVAGLSENEPCPIT